MASNDPIQTPSLDEHRVVSVTGQLKGIRVAGLFNEAAASAKQQAEQEAGPQVSTSAKLGESPAKSSDRSHAVGPDAIDIPGKIIDALLGPGKSRAEEEFTLKSGARGAGPATVAQGAQITNSPAKAGEISAAVEEQKSAAVAGALAGAADGGMFNQRNGIGDGSLAISSQLDANQVQGQVRSQIASIVRSNSDEPQSDLSKSSALSPGSSPGSSPKSESAFAEGDRGLVFPSESRDNGPSKDPLSTTKQKEKQLAEQVRDLRNGSKADLLGYLTDAHEALKAGNLERYTQITDLASGRFSRSTMQAFAKMEREFRTRDTNLA